MGRCKEHETHHTLLVQVLQAVESRLELEKGQGTCKMLSSQQLGYSSSLRRLSEIASSLETAGVHPDVPNVFVVQKLYEHCHRKGRGKAKCTVLQLYSISF